MSPFRIVDMYSRVLTAHKKAIVLDVFSKVNGKLRLVIATTTYEMGVDCPAIKRIIHWGSPCTIEEYVHETGHSGRDGTAAVAILYKAKGNKGLAAPLKQYLENAFVCRSKLLFQHFQMVESRSYMLLKYS